MKTYKFIIGIDPGTETGLAIWNNETKQLERVDTLPIHKAMESIRQLKDRSILVRVEDARLRKWIPKERDLKQVVGRAKGAGSVSRDCNIWEDFLKDAGVDYGLVAPKSLKTKMKEAYWKQITGWTKRTSSHSRDAVMLVFGF